MDCSNAVKQGMKQPGDVDAAALLDLALDEIAAVNDKEVGKPPFGVGVARISALNCLFAADLEREGHGLQLQDQIDRLIEKKDGLINKAIEYPVLAPGLVKRGTSYADHPAHLWAATCALEHLLNHTGELQTEVERRYSEEFTGAAGAAAPSAIFCLVSRGTTASRSPCQMRMRLRTSTQRPRGHLHFVLGGTDFGHPLVSRRLLASVRRHAGSLLVVCGVPVDSRL